jgi:acetolactate synthase-1/3 small subunit
MSKFTVELFANNWAGVLDRATGLYEKEALNIDSIDVAPTVEPEVSKITIVGTGKDKAEKMAEKMRQMAFVKACNVIANEAVRVGAVG